MSRDIAGEIKDKYGDIEFYNPKIYFGFNAIELSGILSFLEEIYFVIPLLFVWIPIFILDSPGFTIFYLTVYIYYCYEKVFALMSLRSTLQKKKFRYQINLQESTLLEEFLKGLS